LADQAGLTRQTIPPEKLFPAGDSRFTTEYVPLQFRSGQIVARAIECGDRTSQSVVFCVHGWACSVFSFRKLMPLLAANGDRVIAIDLPGHGLSEKPNVAALYTLDRMAECVIAAMDTLGITRATLVGHSMGGPICARVAVLAPGRVSGLALLAPAGFGTEWELRILRAITPHLFAPIIPHLLRRWMIAFVLRASYGSLIRPSEKDIDEYWAPSRLHGWVKAMWDLLHCFEWNAGIDEGFGSISVPALIMDGREDNLIARRWVRRYSEVLANARFEILEGCGHVVPEEAPERVAAAIGALIR
jgi:pimeloyl-ACP methyl ester carboxylesterase